MRLPSLSSESPISASRSAAFLFRLYTDQQPALGLGKRWGERRKRSTLQRTPRARGPGGTASEREREREREREGERERRGVGFGSAGAGVTQRLQRARWTGAFNRCMSGAPAFPLRPASCLTLGKRCAFTPKEHCTRGAVSGLNAQATYAIRRGAHAATQLFQSWRRESCRT